MDNNLMVEKGLLDISHLRRHIDKLNEMIADKPFFETLEREREESIDAVKPALERFDKTYSSLIPNKNCYHSSHVETLGWLMMKYNQLPNFWLDKNESITSAYIIVELKTKPPTSHKWPDHLDNRFEGIRVFYECNGELLLL